MSPWQNIKLSSGIKEKALDLGFDLVGIAPSAILKENGDVLSSWCAEGMNADMGYLSRDIAKRINPELLFPGTKSVIVTALNYYTEKKQGGNGVPILSRYTYGRNYHDVITGKLNVIIEYLKKNSPGSSAKGYVDSAPILEKAWAARAGLGWQGRHSVLINSKLGSFFFLGIILTDAELSYDEPATEDLCGLCRLCIESCPTGAINENRTIDARKCIAYLTIESKQPLTANIVNNFEGRVFGCDKCQEVCPWNRNAQTHDHPEFAISEEVSSMTSSDWLELTEEDFRRLFGPTPAGRRKYEIFISNVRNLMRSA